MIQFYNEFILPSSPCRSKLSIHLIAQGTSTRPETTANGSFLTNDNVKVHGGIKCIRRQDGIFEEEHDGPQPISNIDGEYYFVDRVLIKATTPYVITDIRQFKAMLQTTAGSQPVKHISEFEEP